MFCYELRNTLEGATDVLVTFDIIEISLFQLNTKK